MEVYVLTFEVGLSSGHKDLIGIYATEEKAEEALERHMRMRKYCYGRYHYSINEIELNKEVNITFAEW